MTFLPNNRKPVNFLSLFSGCGGFDLGIEQAGFKCLAAFDIDSNAVNTHRRNLGNKAEVWDLSDARLPCGFFPPVDILIAGPPCQGFSTAGRRKVDDPRNKLLLVAGRITMTLRPSVAIIENVTGVTAGAHKSYWDALEFMLRSIGYRTAVLRCEGIRLGIPQHRTRMVMFAWRTGREIQPILPMIDGGVLYDAINNVDGLMNHDTKLLLPSSDHYHIAQHIGPGQKLCNVRNGASAVHTWDIPEVFGQVTDEEKKVLEVILRARRRNRIRSFGDADPVSIEAIERDFHSPVGGHLLALVEKGYVRHVEDLFDLTHTFNGKYKRLSWDAPSPTVDTRFGDPRYFLHPVEHRGLTVREAARIQGFPNSFVFDGLEHDHYRMIGNAVPPPIARCLAPLAMRAYRGW